MKAPELLSPAGNFEKMKAALLYGADAVYLAGNMFGMRAAADNFTLPELHEAVAYAHARGKKVYLTVNTMPHSDEYPRLRAYLESLADCPIDAMIVADLGVMALIREVLPEMEIHVSTQASAVSAPAVLAYAALGARRVVLARELTLAEVAEIRREIDASGKDVELETFVHGSMCVSYSGRCLLSNHFTGRDGNRGACAQPCRWNYTITEEKRPGMPLPIEEHENGTFILSSKDMCTIEHIPELCAAGIDSFKIEGRMKSAYYTAVVTNAYRMALDAYLADPVGYRFDPAWMRELESVSHREYDTGFWFDRPMDDAKLVTSPGYLREKAYFATALPLPEALPEGLVAENADGKLYLFMQRNKLSTGDAAELISPRKTGKPFVAREMYGEDGSPIPSCPHPGMKFYLRVPFPVSEGDILRAGEDS